MAAPNLQFAPQIAQARQLFSRGDFSAAAPILRKIVERQPANAEALYDLARCHIQLGEFADARKRLEQTIRLVPRQAVLHSQLARVHMLENNFPAAHRCVDEALRLAPGTPEFLARKADIFFTQGDYPAAYDALRERIDAGDDSPDIAFAFARIAPKVSQTEKGVELLQRMLATEQPVFMRSQALFRLGALLDKLKRYDDAFAAYAEGNRLRAHRYDPARHARIIDELIAAWTPEAIARLPRNTQRNELHVFIVGMPRSGTTLVEQILASHSKVFGAGEPNDLDVVANSIQPPAPGEAPHVSNLALLTPKTIERAAREYTRAVLVGSPAGAQRITDKMPVNFMHLGLISILFPQARIIHTTRKPLDTCLSCHFQSWTSVFPWVNDLAHIGAYYNDYLRLMAHWKNVLSLPILDVSYEQLTADQEPWSRRMIDFIGLPWDDRCLRFYETQRRVQNMNQDLVRQPIYRSSVERWRHYEKHLGPLKAALNSSGGAIA